MAKFNKELFSTLLLKAKGDRSLNQFSNNAGVDVGYLSKLINMRRDTAPSVDIIKRIYSQANNNVSLTDLMNAAGHTRMSSLAEESIPETVEFIKVPIYNEITSGGIITVQGYDYIYMPKLNESDYFYITVPDNSMLSSRIRSGDLALVEKVDKYNEGDILLLLVNGRATLRRVYKEDNLILLVSENVDYPPIILSDQGNNYKKISIWGKIIHIKFNI